MFCVTCYSVLVFCFIFFFWLGTVNGFRFILLIRIARKYNRIYHQMDWILSISFIFLILFVCVEQLIRICTRLLRCQRMKCRLKSYHVFIWCNNSTELIFQLMLLLFYFWSELMIIGLLDNPIQSNPTLASELRVFAHNKPIFMIILVRTAREKERERTWGRKYLGFGRKNHHQ